MVRRLTDHSVLTFDCYGTLIDWESGIWSALQPLLVAGSRGDVTRKQALVAFNHYEAEHQTATPTLPYPDLLERVHRSLAEHLDLSTSASLDETFGKSVPSWPAFPDSGDALRLLSGHFDLVILSNVDRAGFAASNERLGVEFDAVYTAEDIGSYKPDPANFEYLIEHAAADLGHGKADILHTAQSIRHDHIPARRVGLDNAWIDRNRLSETAATGLPAMDHVFFSMTEIADAVVAESEAFDR
ncbi:MAG: HAD hydrolase-like protein [Actinobacteria bacterium]|nr:HAD hydrolase-like protein [Actinomycetota bacterium]